MNHVATMAARPSDHTEPTEVSRAGAKISTEKRRPIRRDPEKRRQQNIQAQKKYRDKVRKRLNNLEALAASVASTDGEAPLSTLDAVPSAASTGGLEQQNCLTMVQYSHSSNHVSSAATTFDIESNFNTDSSGLACDPPNWDSTTSIDPSHLIVDRYRSTTSPCWVIEYVDCGCPARHVQIRWCGPPKHETYQIFKIGPISVTADPYLNSLRIERVCCVDAIWSNCLCLGLEQDTFCGDDAVSPFSRPTRSGVDDGSNDSIVHTVQSMFKTLKPDLRPTREQIVINHPPWSDVLPFPTFRKNIIKRQEAVDAEDLFQDLMDGLICWGGTGIGRRERDCSTGHASTGTPWDSRSWEAKPWFIRKYWELLGGEEGELVRQSEWWRNMRGDESDPLLDFSISVFHG